MKHGKKTLAVTELLKQAIDTPTKDIIAMIKKKYNMFVSERQVQRVRKEHKKIIEDLNENESQSKLEDQSKGEDMNNIGMEDWEIDLLNYANEGGWSIQQLAEKLDKTFQEIEKTLIDCHYMIHAEVLDESNENVFFFFFSKDSDWKSDFVIEGRSPRSSSRVLPKEEDFWEVKIDCIESCGKIDKTVDVFMNKNSRGKAMLFMKWAKAREWLAYLIGEKKDDVYYISDLYLPDQRTSATLVDKVVADKYNKMKVVGVIHSHHDMGAGDENHPSFSGHDRAFINGNHNLSLLAGNKVGGGFKIVGIARSQTPCGSMVTVKAAVKVMVEENPTEDALKKVFFEKVFNDRNIYQGGSGVTTIRNGEVIKSGEYGFSDRYPQQYPAKR